MKLSELDVIRQINSITNSYPEDAINAIEKSIAFICERRSLNLKGISFYAETEDYRIYTNKGIPCPKIYTTYGILHYDKRLSEYVNESDNTTIRLYSSVDESVVVLDLTIDKDSSQYFRAIMKR